jgi:hypothetical protein
VELGAADTDAGWSNTDKEIGARETDPEALQKAG